MTTVLREPNYVAKSERNQKYCGPLPGSACAFKRTAILAANERKVFILHDEHENATVARIRTVSLACLFDQENIVTYYRNAPHISPLQKGDEYRASWSGTTPNDLQKGATFVRYTMHHKGVYVAMIGLGQSRRVLELIAKEHELQETTPAPELSQSDADYPITLLTPTVFTTFYVPKPAPFSENVLSPLPSIALPDQEILNYVKEMIRTGKRMYSKPVPCIEELRAAKLAKRKALIEAARQKEEDLRIWRDLKRRQEEGEDVMLPEKPLSGRQMRRRQKQERQAKELWGDEDDASSIYSMSKPDLEYLRDSPTNFISNYITAPTAEPVVPCQVHLLDDMIQWLQQDVDIVAEQEPRIDFVRGSILGKTTQGGGTSVDLCKQVVGPKGIGPILEAVGKNSHIDRFLLGNNIVGDNGAKIIADFMSSEKSKRIYNFYIAGNAIGPEGIQKIAAALAHNTTVTALWLKRNPLLPEGAKHIASMLSTNTNLQTLDLVNTGILDQGVIALMEALKQNPNSALRHIYLGCNAETVVSGRAIGEYLKTGQSKLTSLFLSSSRLGDEGIIAIAEGLKVDKTLERLGLESVRVGDAGAKALAEALEHHPSITMLDLGFRKGTFDLGERPNIITDVGLDEIGRLLIGPPGARKRNVLRHLNLSHNNISPKGAADFIKTYVEDNEHLLEIRLVQSGKHRNLEVEHITKRLTKERREKYFDPNAILTEDERKERERVKDALEPRHIAEIYSIYRGCM